MREIRTLRSTWRGLETWLDREASRPKPARQSSTLLSGGRRLSRDSWFDQRKDDALSVQLLHGLVNRVVERFGVGKGLMRQVVRLEIMPDHLDVVEFRRILRQPLDGEPVCAGGKRRHREFARVDRAIVLDEHHRLDGLTRSGAIKPVELLKVGDEVAAALGRAGVDGELPRGVVERTQHRDLPGLSRCRHTQVRPRLCPCACEIGVRQRLALVAIEEDNVASLSLLFAQLQAKADAFDLAGDLASLQRVPRPPPTKLFLRNALDNCERLMRTPSRASISPRRRGIVQLRRLATGSSSKGVTTRSAVSLFTGAGPGATRACSASTPPPAKSLRQRRTVSSRTPNASAICGLLQPDSVSSTARARSASPRSREPASLERAARCSSVAVSGDFPAISRTCESMPVANQTAIRWSICRNLLSVRHAAVRRHGIRTPVLDAGVA